MAKYPEPGWLEDITEQIRREVAVLAPADIVDREMIRVLTLVIESLYRQLDRQAGITSHGLQ